MDTLFPRIRQHFESLEGRLVCFRKQEVQVEGWFKGELLYLLSLLKDQGHVGAFGREAGAGQGRAKVDVSVTIGPLTHWIELKHWLVGVQRGARLDPPFYFGDPTSVGILKDVDKLVGLGRQSPKWLLILMTDNPGGDLWEKGLARFHRKFAPRHLMALSDPRDFPPSYYLGLLRVGEGG